jgi:hypothetical protein
MHFEQDDQSLTIVPSNASLPDLPTARRVVHEKSILCRRTQLLEGLRGFPMACEVAQTLRRENTYRLVLPTGRMLQKGKDGLFSGVIYDEKGIAAHARFLKSRTGALQVAKCVGTQFLLINVAVQLTRIERLVQSVIRELHRDRIAEIQAGLIGLNEAIAIEDLTTRRLALTNIAQTLNSGLQKCYLEMKAGTASLPDSKNSFWDNWGLRSKSAHAAETLQPLQETLESYLSGLAGIAECYSLMDEPTAATVSLRSRLHQLRELDMGKVAAAARLVPARANAVLPEEPWRKLSADLTIFEQQVAKAESTNAPGSQICIELTGKELAEASHERAYGMQSES